MVNEAGEYIRSKVKKKVLRFGEISILIMLGFILISFGIANILASFYPLLSGGYNYLIVGILFLMASFLLKI